MTVDMNFNEGIILIQKALNAPLPGAAAQHILAPKLRKTTEELLAANPNPRRSSVMMLLFPGRDNKLHTVLIERPTNNSIHSGQIAFPGGSVDQSDKDEMVTALRETEEEIGIPASTIKIIGSLSKLFIPASKFLVSPFVGALDTSPQFHLNPAEVNSVITISIAELLKLTPATKAFQTSYGLIQAPYFPLGEHAVWGATAMMLSEFREVLKTAGQE